MQSELTRYEMTCPYNGEVCCDGIRSDFKPNKDGKIKQCRMWTAIKGKDPQSETVIDFFDCAHAWVPVVTLEASQMVRQNTATLQEFRNESQEALNKLGNGLKSAAIAFNNMAEAQRDFIQGIELPSIENKEQNGYEN